MPVKSYPWRFASVISVGSHERDDPYEIYANPAPPVEFFARGLELDVAWIGGGSCASPATASPRRTSPGCARSILSKHPELTPCEVKTVLQLTASQRRERAMTDELRAAVAAGVLGAEVRYRSCCGSIVEVARAMFRAAASSIFLLDEATDELVFEAVSGEGEEELIGRRFPSGTGIAGWVARAGSPS